MSPPAKQGDDARRPAGATPDRSEDLAEWSRGVGPHDNPICPVDGDDGLDDHPYGVALDRKLADACVCRSAAEKPLGSTAVDSFVPAKETAPSGSRTTIRPGRSKLLQRRRTATGSSHRCLGKRTASMLGVGKEPGVE
jgi:hypothetical protein